MTQDSHVRDSVLKTENFTDRRLSDYSQTLQLKVDLLGLEQKISRAKLNLKRQIQKRQNFYFKHEKPLDFNLRQERQHSFFLTEDKRQ